MSGSHRPELYSDLPPEFIATLLGSAPVGVAFLDADLRYLAVTPRLAEMNGRPPDDHFGRRAEDLLELPRELTDWVRGVLASRTAATIEVALPDLRDPERRPLWWRGTCRPVFGQGGDLLGAIVLVEEITEVRRLEAERTELTSRLATLAHTDELTGLPNRRAWHGRLLEALAGSNETSLCVALVDIDEFKAYNDGHGHLAGDRLLREAAAAWSGVLRDGDVLARLGGDEFAVLLQGCDLDAARATVERLRRRTPGGATCSIGIAHAAPEEAAEALLHRADQALYHAKRTGRDRSVAAPSRDDGTP